MENKLNIERMDYINNMLKIINWTMETFEEKILNVYGDKDNKDNNQYVIQSFNNIFEKLKEKSDYIQETELESILISLENGSDKIPYILKEIKNNTPYIYSEEIESNPKLKEISLRIDSIKEELTELKEEFKVIDDKNLKEMLKENIKSLEYELKYKTFILNNQNLTKPELNTAWEEELIRTQKMNKNKNINNNI